MQDAFNEEFLDAATGEYAKDSQSAQAMALVVGIVPEAVKDKVFDCLVRNITGERNNHLSTGIVGTYFLYQALHEFGRPDLALKIITVPDYPGFEHMLTRVLPATPLPSGTVWEDWGGLSSLAHPVQGCVVSFLYECLAGIQPSAESPGFKRFHVAPEITGDVRWVEASLDTCYGRVKSRWWFEGKSFHLVVSIPVNTSATIRIPFGRVDSLVEKDRPAIALKKEDGIASVREGLDSCARTCMFIEAGSGEYHFKVSLP